jgi:hypothetical protein
MPPPPLLSAQIPYLAYSSTLKIEVACSPETFVGSQRTTLSCEYIPKDRTYLREPQILYVWISLSHSSEPTADPQSCQNFVLVSLYVQLKSLENKSTFLMQWSVCTFKSKKKDKKKSCSTYFHFCRINV